MREICMKKLKTQNSPRGLVYVFTGDGKGKTSAAFWTGMRMALRGERVAVVQFYKESRWLTAEQLLTDKIKSFEVYLFGKGFYIKSQNHNLKIKTRKLGKSGLVVDKTSREEHRRAAGAGLAKAGELIASGKYVMVILDEVCNAVGDGLINLINLIDLISKRGKVHLVLTGREAHKRLIAAADLVTECRKIKHPFDKGMKAVKGLDF